MYFHSKGKIRVLTLEHYYMHVHSGVNGARFYHRKVNFSIHCGDTYWMVNKPKSPIHIQNSFKGMPTQLMYWEGS